MPPTAPPSPNSASATTAKSLLPPKEVFWQRYSPHNEFPLSTVASIVVHCVVGFGLLYLGVRQINQEEDSKPLPLDAIVIAGGGGNPNGVENGERNGVAPTHGTEEGALVKAEKPTGEKTSPDDLAVPTEENVKLPPELDSDRVISAATNPSIKGLSSVSKDVQKKLFAGIAAKGKAGTGTGGGQGEGTGTGTGNARGAGNANINQRQQRVLRWTMIFDTRSPQDYLNQLTAMKAIVAVPLPDTTWEIFDLSKHPLRGKVEDIARIKRIFWVDNNLESVHNLLTALRLQPGPTQIVAFFPPSVEEKLLNRELDYGRHHGRPEEKDIAETKFKVKLEGGGYEPFVVDQH